MARPVAPPPWVPGSVIVGSLTAGALYWAVLGPALRRPVPPMPPPAVAPPSVAPEVWPPEGPLSGLVVYLSPGHGKYLQKSRYSDKVLAWDFQREPSPEGIQEDLWTARFAWDWLVPALEAQGATVVPLRELDPNPVALRPERVVGATVRPSGGWWVQGNATFVFGPKDTGRTGLSVRWEGDCAGTALITDAQGTRATELPDTGHGGHWWRLPDVRAVAGTEVTVSLQTSGCKVDDLKLGGGTYRFPSPWSGQPTATPYWQVASTHYLGALPPEIGLDPKGRAVSDARHRAVWASWVHPEGEDALYLSLHTNAGFGRGTYTHVGIEVAPTRIEASPASLNAARAIHPALVSAARSVQPRWRERGVHPLDVSEVSPKWNTLPASVLIEIGYHDHSFDAASLKNPVFRQAVARGIVAGISTWRSESADPTEESADPSPAGVDH